MGEVRKGTTYLQGDITNCRTTAGLGVVTQEEVSGILKEN